MNEIIATGKKKDFDQMENNLAAELRNLCDENGKEREPQKSAEVLHKLGRIYFERSKAFSDDGDGRLMMISLIRSACLLNAAIARKSKSVQKIKNDLITLCHHLLISAGAREKNADLITQSKLIQKDVEAMRKMVRQKLSDIQLLDNKRINRKRKERKKILAIKTLQEEIASRYTKTMADLLQFCQSVMGDSPCNFALVGMGSLARKEITPYSDFEHIIVLEKNARQKSDYDVILNYFRWLSVIFQIIIINLQETIVPSVNIPSLKEQNNKHWFFDEITTRGICFDGMMPHACKFPLGRIELTEQKIWTTELIKPVDEMLKYLSADEDMKNGYHLRDILTKVCYVGGDKYIFDQFQTKVFDSLRKENYNERKNSIKQILVDDLENFATRSKLLDLSSTSFDIKKDFYRSSTLFISALGQLHNVEASSCFEISEKLEEQKVISKEVKHYQMYAVALACELRLKWYMKQKRQDDCIKSKTDSSDSIQELLQIMKAPNTIKYFQITYALQCEVSKTFDLKKVHFYTIPKLLNCKLYYRFKEFDKFQIFLKSFVKADFGKTARLYSTKEIMKKLELESKLQLDLKRNSLFETKTNEDEVMELTLHLGKWLQTQKSYDEALELYQLYLDLIKTRKDKCKKTSNQKYIDALDNIGQSLIHMNKPGEAFSYLQRSMKIKEKASIDISTDVGFARTLNEIGQCLMYMNKPGEAFIYLQRSMTIKKNASIDISTDADFATTLVNIGQCLINMHKYDEAFSCLQRSLTIYERASTDISTDVDYATTLNNIGYCLIKMHKPNEAFIYLQRSLTIKEKASIDISTDVDFATTLVNIGQCLTGRLQPDKACSYLERSLLIYEKASIDISTDADYAAALNNIGQCFMEMHKPGKAFVYLQRSMTIKEKASFDISTDVDFAIILNNIGLCLLDMHKPGEALNYLQRSLIIFNQLFNDIRTDVNFALALNTIAKCLLKINKPGEALIYLQKSLTIYEKAFIDNNVPQK